jgi:UDP-glucose 4-epimerase
MAAETSLEVTILRAPLVYGPEVRGNMERLIRLIRRGVPLPLGRARNKRSFLFVGNFADAIVRSVDHPAAANQTFLVSDGEDISTADLACRLMALTGRSVWLVPIPLAAARFLGRLVGRSPDVSRLFDSLQADTTKIATLLNWRPPSSLEQGLSATFSV